MLAEDYLYHEYGDISTSINKGTTVALIVRIIKKASPHFKKARMNNQIKESLNENELTQIFVEQVDTQIRKARLPFGVKNQYSDIFYGTRGIPDFYFHRLDEGKTSIALFIVESKRLPAPPPKKREKEYVIGPNHNGGIERFKNGSHGKGLTECGMLGFVEQQNFNFWHVTINNWIDVLAKADKEWSLLELLKLIESKSNYCHLISLVKRRSADKLKLHHLWIKT